MPGRHFNTASVCVCVSAGRQAKVERGDAHLSSGAPLTLARTVSRGSAAFTAASVKLVSAKHCSDRMFSLMSAVLGLTAYCWMVTTWKLTQTHAWNIITFYRRLHLRREKKSGEWGSKNWKQRKQTQVVTTFSPAVAWWQAAFCVFVI